MKKNIRISTILLFLLITMGQHVLSQETEENTTPDFENWTEEQIKHWEDSIQNSYFPPLKLDSIDRSSIKQPVQAASPRTSIYNLSNSYVPNSVTVDQNKAVGEIPLTQTSNQNGTLTYNVPIEIYPGTRQFQPQIALVYNSHSNNGVVGKGWNISGLSGISRTTKSIYYDDAPMGISMTKDDALTLDGMRLIKLSETSEQISYETEQGMIKVNAFLSGIAIRYLEVFYPNGRKGVYGNTENYSNQLQYPLTSLSDLQGNTISFTYSFADNHHTITKITYGEQAYASVEFTYTSGHDPVISYQAGYKVQETQLLHTITCKFGSTTLRTYELAYQFRQFVPLLTQIGCTASGASLNPLQFYYGEGNSDISYTSKTLGLVKWYTGATPGQLRLSKGKFDYDSEDEGLTVAVNNYPYWNHQRDGGLFHHSQYRYDNQYDKLYEDKISDRIFVYGSLNDNFYASFLGEISIGRGFIDVFCTNLDGKYEDEVIKVNNAIESGSDRVTFTVFEANLYYGLAPKYTRTFDFPIVLQDMNDTYSIHPKFYYPGDFNGDGKTEILAVSCHNPLETPTVTSKCYLFDLESNTKLYEGYVFPHNVEFWGTNRSNFDETHDNSDRIYIMDYDGDGKSDICHISNAGVKMYTFVSSGSNYSLEPVSDYYGLKKSDLKSRSLLLGEVNGDGKPDFLLSPPKTNSSDYTWSIYYSRGNGQFEKTTCNSTNNFSGLNYFMQDVNGDGLTDLIAALNDRYLTYLVGNNIIPYLSDGNTSTLYPENSSLVPVDINGSNNFSQLISLKDGELKKFAYPRNDTKEKLLSGVVSSTGIVQKHYFQRLSETEAFHAGWNATFPYENYSGPLYVPVVSEGYFNGQRKGLVSFSYENAVIHKQGLGFRGFGEVKTNDNTRGRVSTQTFDPYNYGIPKSDDSPTAQNTYNFSVTVQADKIVKTLLNNRSSTDKLKGTTVSSSYIYDSYGNPTQETIDYGGGITTTTDNSYFNDTNEASYLLGFLVDKTTTSSRNGAQWSQRMHIPSYTNGLPNEIVKYTNGNRVSNETYKYDDKWNVESETVRGYSSATSLKTTYTYDDYDRLVSETDPMKLKTTYEYDPTDGTLSVQKNYKQQATTYTYDAFKRAIGVQYPDGTNESTLYSWISGGTNGLYSISNFATGKPTSEAHYDALGRETRNSVVRFNGAESHVDNLYDSYGRLEKSSLPFTGSSASHWNTTAYDQYDRPVSVREASGKETLVAYNGVSATTTQDGIATTKTVDAQGNVISVSDPAGTITYDLRPDGQPASITAPGDIVTSFGYDDFGRQTSINDPSAGTQSYTYDDAGFLKTETDANNKVTSFEYDTLGRIKTKTYPEFNVKYYYNTYGLLVRMLSSNGTFNSYAYDTFDRLYLDTENGMDKKWLQKQYGYTNGNTSSIQYKTPSGVITTENYVYSHGNLAEIKLNNQTSIWKLNAENDLGQPIAVTTGNFSRSYGYDTYGLPTSRTAGSFQDYSYSFDAAKGNLTYRKDNRYGLQEDFTYDGLNRLTDYKDAGIGYDYKGNITAKTDMGGAFYYATPGKPYAISGFDDNFIAIPNRNQAISYTSFKRPNSITEGSYNATFVYNCRGERAKMELKKNGVSELKRHYLSGQYELDEGVAGTKEKLYLAGDAYSAPAVYVKQGSGNWELFYICRDYLGSITHITNSSGLLVQELSYDAWGRLRNPSTMIVYGQDHEPELFLGRGYTGHEYLPMFGLINMNARLYDPVLGRFLSPDPYVQAPDMTQNYNRYSYAMNNPMCYIDESGESISLIIVGVAALIGGGINLGIKASQGEINDWGDGFIAFGIGATAGVAGAFTGGAAYAAMSGIGITGFAAGVVSSSMAYAASAPIQNLGNHACFGDPLMRPKDYAIGLSIVALTGGATNGTIAALKGNNFWTGKDVSFGRSPFSLSNTPTRTAPQLAPIPGKPIAVQTPEVVKPTNASKPIQNHHFATDKNQQFTPRMKDITDKYGLDLNGDWNKASMPHQGRHPNDYHQWVFENMQTIDKIPGMNQQEFIRQFKREIIEPTLKNPSFLNKSHW